MWLCVVNNNNNINEKYKQIWSCGTLGNSVEL